MAFLHRVLVPLLLLLAPLAAQADEIFRWTDDEGEVHYTNDPDAIPANKRTKAKVTKGTELGHVNAVDGKDGKDSKKKRVPPPVDSEASKGAPIEVAMPAEPEESEQTWRAAFRQAHEKIEGLERGLERDRQKLEDPAGHGMAISRD